MKKLIIKTACITLGAVVFLTAVVFGLFVLAFPKKLADFNASCGNYKFSAYLYERQYKKSNDPDDLFILVDFSNEYEDSERCYEYSGKVLDFDLSEQNAEYYYGKFVVSAFNCGKREEGLKACEKFVEKYGYTSHNPFKTLIYDGKINLSKEDYTAVKISINNLSVNGEKTSGDLAIIDSLINK